MAKEFIRDWKFRKADQIANISKWWKGEESARDYGLPDSNTGLSSWLADFAVRYDIADSISYDDVGPFQFCNYADIIESLNCFDPEISRVKGADQIIIYQSATKRGLQLRLALNPGKAIRRIFPTIPDKYLDRAVDEFKVKFDSGSYEIVWGDSREQFKRAYLWNNTDRTANIRFTDWRKSQANSCMRHDFEDRGLGGVHPCEAYASGDFQILFAINKTNGLVSARCVVRNKPKLYAPIYGTNDNAIDLLEAELASQDYVRADSDYRPFNGARLLKLDVKPGYIAAPYLDVGPTRIDVPDSDDEFVILTSNGDREFGCTSGLFKLNTCYCYNCGDSINRSQSSCDDDGNYYCDDCYSERFTYCPECEDTCETEDLETVWFMDGSGFADSQRVCPDCRRNNYTRIDTGHDNGRYWRDSDTVETGSGHTISQRDCDDNYFLSDHSNEYWPSDERVETEDGEVITEDEARGLGLIELECGDWGKPDANAIAESMLQKAGRVLVDKTLLEFKQGQYLLFDNLTNSAYSVECEETELPTLGGLIFWPAIESVTLLKYPAIKKIESECGRVWFEFESGRYVSYAGNLTTFRDETFQFETLAECVAAFNARN